MSPEFAEQLILVSLVVAAIGLLLAMPERADWYRSLAAFGAAVAVEAICDVPGIGQLALKAAGARDLPVLVTLTIVVALVTQVANLVADCCAPALRSEA